jgi:hypothetical protein
LTLRDGITICPGQNFLEAYPKGPREIEGKDGRQLGPAPGAGRQAYEMKWKILGRKLSTAAFSSAWTPLRTRIYKIRTLLSTGFVDNPIPGGKRTGRRALSGAAFRAAAGPQGEHAR